MKRLLNFIPLLLTIFLVLTLSYSLSEAPVWKYFMPKSTIPPLGHLLSPFHGFWQNGESGEVEDRELTMAELKSPVQVFWDERHVPHVFAQNDHDLYYTQGYITASERYFQMDMQIRDAGGRLSEVLGEVTLSRDQWRRRLGMRQAAEQTIAHMKKDPTTKVAVEAYTKGINAWIESLSPPEYPLEYKLLDFEPEPWTELKTALLLKLMAWDLTGYNTDYKLDNARKKYGQSATDSIYPNYAPYQDPVIPPSKQWEFEPKAIPDIPKAFQTPENTPPSVAPYLSSPAPYQPDPNNGSNSWAVSADKSVTGYPVLANDPHLNLNLPSIWFEMQLHTPEVNTYGVTLPGAPGVIIGFNEKVAWGVTNVGADVQDWYKIKFKDKDKKKYYHDSTWKKTQPVVEEILVRGKDEPVIETVYYTHHGPVALLQQDTGLASSKSFESVPTGYAMRWEGAVPANEFLTFHKLNRAENYDDYTEALETYACPAQNFAFISVDKDIALWANGRFPVRWEGQGKYLLDGSKPTHDWAGYMPHSHNPHIKNPERGFVSSANQHSTAQDYPYYQNWRYADYYRGARINEMLAKMENITIDSMRLLQLDELNMRARKVLPKMLELLDETGMNDTQRKAAKLLKAWRYRMYAKSAAAAIYNTWWTYFMEEMWADELPEPLFRYPEDDRAIQFLLEEPTARWFDNINTQEVKEQPDDLLRISFIRAVDSLKKDYGNKPAQWKWWTVKNTKALALTRIPAFTADSLAVGGCPDCVNATKPQNGPSWRMVVAHHPDPKRFRAYGIYPGGQSGNPGSPHYNDFVETWESGELQELNFLRSAKKRDGIVSTTTLKPGD